MPRLRRARGTPPPTEYNSDAVDELLSQQSLPAPPPTSPVAPPSLPVPTASTRGRPASAAQLAPGSAWPASQWPVLASADTGNASASSASVASASTSAAEEEVEAEGEPTVEELVFLGRKNVALMRSRFSFLSSEHALFWMLMWREKLADGEFSPVLKRACFFIPHDLVRALDVLLSFGHIPMLTVIDPSFAAALLCDGQDVDAARLLLGGGPLGPLGVGRVNRHGTLEPGKILVTKERTPKGVWYTHWVTLVGGGFVSVRNRYATTPPSCLSDSIVSAMLTEPGTVATMNAKANKLEARPNFGLPLVGRKSATAAREAVVRAAGQS